MGTIIDKLNFLITKKKDLVNLINTKTNYRNNTSGLSKVFTGKYSDADFTDIVTHANTLYPIDYLELVCIKHYNNGVLDMDHMPYYQRPGVSVSATRTGTGSYNVSFSLTGDMAGNQLIIHTIGGHCESNFNNSGYASFMRTNQYYEDPKITVYTADDGSLNDGAFTIIAWKL